MSTLAPTRVQVRIDDLDFTEWKCRTDEDFAARVTVDGHRWCRQHDGRWANEHNRILARSALTGRRTVALGWGDDQ